MAAVVVMLFMCLAPLVFVFPTSTQQGCFVSLRTRAASWTFLPFCACFSYGYLWPCCHSRRRREITAAAAAAAQEEEVSKEKAMGMMHRMRERMLSTYVVCVYRRTSASGRASSLSSGEQSCCHRGVPRLIQLVKVVFSLVMLVQAPITPCSGVVRLDGQVGGYSDEFQLGNKGTDALVFNRGYKQNELLSPAKDWISGDFHSFQEGAAVTEDSSSTTPENHARADGQSLEKRDASWKAEDGARVINDAAATGGEIEGGVGLPAEDQPLSNSGSPQFGRLTRDCFRAKCSPSLASSIDLKQQSLNDELPGFAMKATEAVPPPQVSIIPPFLEWGEQSLYTPSTSSLTVVNTCNSTELRVFQPFSTNLQFYASGFEESVVSPGEMLSIPIVFLPRVVGPADGMLIVQTSAGGFLIHAQGKAVGSPYQVVSLQGLRMESGETLRSTITLYNPHEEVLNVTNVYVRLSRVEDSSFQSSSNSASTFSSGSTAAAADHDPSLGNGLGEGISPCSESPSGAFELDPKAFHGGVITRLRRSEEAGQQHPASFEPQSQESIADLEFEAIDVGRYTGSLHIMLQKGVAAVGEMEGSSSDSSEFLVVPVDLQVVRGEAGERERKGGGGQEVVSVVDVLEFGIFTEDKQTNSMDVVLYNPGSEAVAVEDITPVLEDYNIVHIEYTKGQVLPPTSETEVAVVTYMGKEETVSLSHLFQCDSQEFWRDRMLIVKTNSSASPTVEVPYRALVFHGSSPDCGDPAAQGSVGFVPEISSAASTVGGGSAMLMMQGGASGQRRVHFANDRTVPLQLFQDLKKRALNTGTNALLSPSRRDDDFCCYETSPGHLTVAATGQSLILLSSELLFPLVQIGKEELHWVNVVNPSEEPLHVQLLVSSKAEPTGRSCQADDLQSSEAPGLRCRSPGDTLMLAVHDDVSSYASNVFFFADGALVKAVVEPHGNSALGPVIFRPPERCSWTGLLSVWNNLTHVEWIPLLGSGGSGSLTFLDGNDPINQVQLKFDRTRVATVDAGPIEEHAELNLDSESAKSALCSRRVSREFLAKNTGDVHLHVAGVELYGGGCSAHGFVVNSCKEEFLLAPGQSTELSVSFQPDLSTGIFQRDLQLITSAGVVQLPVLAILADYNALCSVVGDSTKLYKALLWVSSLALLVVLTVFFRMLAKEMAIPDTQSPTSVIKSNSPTRDGRHVAPLLLSSHPLVLSKSNSGNRSAFALASGLGARSGIQSELDVQSKAGGGNGPSPGSGSANACAPSGQGKLKDSTTKGSPVRVSKVVGVSDVVASPVTTLGPSASASAAATIHVAESKAELPSPSPSLPGLRVKIPNSAAGIAQKSILGSPMREASSPGATGAQSRKGAAAAFDRRNGFGGKFGGGSNSAKIVPEPLTDGNLPAGGQVMVKQSLSPLVRSTVSKSSSTSNPSVATTVAGDVEKSQQWSPQTPSWSVNSKVKSPKKSSHFLHTSKPALSPSPKHAQAQTHQPWAANEKEKPGRRKKRRSNVSTVKHELVSKVRSGSSSPSSSPASPATPAACSSRSVSPLLQSLDTQHQQSDTPRSSSSSCGGGYSSSGSKDYSKGHALLNATVAPLSKLDVQEHFGKPNATAAAGIEKMRMPPSNTSSAVYWGDSLSVNDASTALREMAQANSIDLTWATLAARGNRSSVEKGSDSSNSVGKRAEAPKDWLSVARKAGGVTDSLTAGREGERIEDRNWPGNNKRGNNCKGNTGSPALTPSATFPRRQGCERGLALAGEDERGIVRAVGAPQPTFLLSKMPPVARAPGAKLIPKPLMDETQGGGGVGDSALRRGEDSEKSKSGNIWSDPAASTKNTGSLSRPSELSVEEDKSVYNIWGDHFQEFSRCSTNIIGSVTPSGTQNGAESGAAGQSLAVLNAAPSFFSSFPVPTLPSFDDQKSALTSLASGLPVSNNTSEGFSVFSQAPDVEALCLPSTLFNSPKTTPRSSYSPYVERNSSVGNSIVVKYSSVGGGEGGSPWSSLKKPRGPYSPSLCPSSHGGNELSSFARSESTGRNTNDTSFWSGLNLNQQQGSSAI